MLLRNPEIDEVALASLISEHYGADTSTLDFAPVGGDGWHYRCPPFWISVRRDSQGHVPSAYVAAGELARSGLEFVLAPLVDDSGTVVHQVGAFPVVVLPLVEGATLWQSGSGADIGEDERVTAMVRRLHDSSCATRLPSETYRLPFASELRTGVESAARAGAHCGPFGEPVRELVTRNRAAIQAMHDEIEQLAAYCRADRTSPVLTHGEPNEGNVLRDTDGRLYLIDWGELKYGPPERDWTSLPRANVPAREQFTRFYRLRWDLGEIAEYVSRFAAPHEGNAEDDAMWRELGLYLHSQ